VDAVYQTIGAASFMTADRDEMTWAARRRPQPPPQDEGDDNAAWLDEACIGVDGRLPDPGDDENADW
jgi:hypothetical protein